MTQKEKYVELKVRNFIDAVSILDLKRENRDDFTPEQEVDYDNARGILGIILASDRLFSEHCLVPIRCSAWLSRLERLTETIVFLEI